MAKKAGKHKPKRPATNARRKPKSVPADPLLAEIRKQWPTLSPEQQKFVRMWSEGVYLFRDDCCKAAGTTRWTEWYWRQTSETYQAAIAWAESARVEFQLEVEAWKRARAGPEDSMSATLLMFLLKAARPDKYRESNHQPVTVTVHPPVIHIQE